VLLSALSGLSALCAGRVVPELVEPEVVALPLDDVPPDDVPPDDVPPDDVEPVEVDPDEVVLRDVEPELVLASSGLAVDAGVGAEAALTRGAPSRSDGSTMRGSAAVMTGAVIRSPADSEGSRSNGSTTASSIGGAGTLAGVRSSAAPTPSATAAVATETACQVRGASIDVS
jgi:hypothetical protein